MPTSKTEKLSVKNFVTAEYLLVCNDIIQGADNSYSIMRIIDQLFAFVFPLQLARFVLVAQIARNDGVSAEEFNSAVIQHQFVLVNPKGESTILTSFNPPDLAGESSDWNSFRHWVDLSGQFSLAHEGIYTFKLLGKIRSSEEYEVLLSRRMPLKLTDGIAGCYIARFSAGNKLTEQGEGMLLLMPDGKIVGGDAGYVYSGKYTVEQGKMHAILAIARQTPGSQSVFGDIENFSLDLTEASTSAKNDYKIDFEGYVAEAPSKRLKLQIERQRHWPAPASQSSV